MADEALLPQNATAFETAESETSARMLAVPADDIRLMRRAASAPAQFLPYLAWERSVDVWDPAWSEATKRAVVAASFDVHQHKGTRYALDVALGAMGLSIATKEWFEYAGGAYRFRLIVNMETIGVYNAALHANIVRVAFSAKNTRSYLDQIGVARPGVPAIVYVGGAVSCRLRPKHSYEPLSFIGVSGLVFAGAAHFSRQSIRLQ